MISKTKQPSLKDIAEAAGVSVMTVSRALNGTGPVADEMRQRVAETARRVGYIPNSSAKAMKTGRFETITLLTTPTNYSPLASRLLLGLINELDRHGYQLLLSQMDFDAQGADAELPLALRELKTDALLVGHVAAFPPNMLEILGHAWLPVAWLNSQQEKNCVYPDDRGGARAGTEYLIQLGHRRISYIDVSNRFDEPRTKVHVSAYERWDGYCEAMRAAGLSPRRIECGKHRPLIERYEVCRKALGRDDRPTAVVGYGESDIHMLLESAGELGLRVPQDVSVICVSNGGYAWHGLKGAWLCLPEHEMGVEAARLCLHRIERPGVDVDPVIVPMGIREGETCAAPII